MINHFKLLFQVENFSEAAGAKPASSYTFTSKITTTRKGAKKTSRTVSEVQKVKSLHFDHDLDEPMLFVHKSSIAIHKSRMEQHKHDAVLDVAIQTEPEVKSEQSIVKNLATLVNFHIFSCRFEHCTTKN